MIGLVGAGLTVIAVALTLPTTEFGFMIPAEDGTSIPVQKVVVATEPTELIVSEGKPEWGQAVGAELLAGETRDTNSGDIARELTGLGLKEAKEVVDGAPSTVKEAATKEEAEEMKAKLEDVGAAVALK